VLAQKRGQALVDSLETELASDKFKNKEDSFKVKILERLSYMHYAINPEQGIAYGKQQYELATKIGWEKGAAMAYNNIAINYQYLSEFDTALKYYDIALKGHEKIDNKKGIASTYGNIGFCYTLRGDFKKALAYDLKALKAFEDMNDKPGIANNLGNIASVYMNIGDYPKALDYSFRALKLNEEMGSKSSVASNMGTIGSIYNRQNDFSKALEYYTKALNLNKELGSKQGLAGNYANIGIVYIYQDSIAKALEYYFKALSMYQELGTKGNIAMMLGNIGEIYGEKHNYTQSVIFLSQALKLTRKVGDRNAEAIVLGNIGEAYMRMIMDTAKNNDIIVSKEFYPVSTVPDSLIPKDKSTALRRARANFVTAIQLQNEVANIEAMHLLYLNLFIADSLLGDYQGAWSAYRQHIVYRDSIFNRETKMKITTLETQRELQLKDKQIEIDKLAVEKKRNERGFFIAGMGLLLLVIGVVLKNNRTQKRSNALLVKEKQRSEDLLLNILPAEVAEELKNMGSAVARYFDDVTVLFTDFVNFTEAGERMSHQKLINELDICFKSFDEIIGSYHVEKIKTIGDAYLAVGGLPTADPNHAVNIVQAAIRIRDFMADRRAKFGNKTFDIRIGIHTGSVIAGIVGIKKFAYDIWGDTVNTAARMQQSSEPGRINISETTYELVKDEFPCLYRGELDAKNKGLLKMYFVTKL